MMILLAIIYLLLVILAVIGFVVLVVGTPIGIFLAIRYFTLDAKKRTKKMLRWLIFSFSGLPILVVTFIIWAIINVITVILGIHLIDNNQLLNR